MKFGEYCLTQGLIDSAMLEDALSVQSYRPARLGRILRELGILTQAQLNVALAGFLPRLELGPAAMAAESLNARIGAGKMPQAVLDYCKNRDLIPFEVTPSHLTFLSTRLRDELMESAEKQFERPCQLILIEPEAWHFILSQCGLVQVSQTASALEIERESSDDERVSEKDPYTSLFRDAVIAAQRAQASDIHIEPGSDGVTLRFRIHGDLKVWKTLGHEHRRGFINQVKRLTHLSVAKSGQAQDGRVSFEGWRLDLRAGLLPGDHGEGIVLRLLDLSRSFEFSDLDLDPQSATDLHEALRAKNGLIVVSGPTGSGKTTTLYTALSSLDRASRKIITLEDPIEYRIAGLTQVPITAKLSFVKALRAVLRHDPDVILVGEIRDEETADLSLKAASTGHLVLSTVHANNATQVIARLTNLGTDPFLLKSVLRYCSAQRLVKKLCPSCSLPLASDHLFVKHANQLLGLQGVTVPPFRMRNPKGCGECHEGSTGRFSVLEYLKKSQIQEYLSNPPEMGSPLMNSLQETCLRRAEKGEVDVQDALEIE